MGNQREIKQTKPFCCCGAILKVSEGHAGDVQQILEAPNLEYYTRLVQTSNDVSFPNLDGPPTKRQGIGGTYVTVPSGGKMWCGYDNFIAHVEHLAPFLEDAVFYVGDELDYIDEFWIEAGNFRRRRIHTGSWVPLTRFLLSEQIIDVLCAWCFSDFNPENDDPSSGS